jgi:hypothetical protein
MTTAAPAVARGLKLIHVGLVTTMLLAVGYVLALGIVGTLTAQFVRYHPWVGFAFVGVLTLIALGTVAGMLTGFVGRCRCLATPEEWPAARTRIRMAVLLEACGWLSGLANFAAAWGIATRWIPLPMIAAGVTAGLSVLMLVLGRVMFLRFARAVADALGHEPLARQAARSLVLFVTLVACGVIGFALLQASYILPASAPVTTVSAALGMGLWVAAVAVGLAGLFVYNRLLGRLRTAVAGTSESATATDEEADK